LSQPKQPRPKPEKPFRNEKQPQPVQKLRPPKPIETVPPPPKQTMEEKIRMLQEKFGRAR
jgi:hypothetical protein